MNEKMASISEMQAIPWEDCQEPMVNLHLACPSIYCMERWGEIFVRKPVAEKLFQIQDRLTAMNRGFRLGVSEGYRSMEQQEKLFLEMLVSCARSDPSMSSESLSEKVHDQMFALPSVAGHPTGGAVDVTIFTGEREWDMGGAIRDFSNLALLPFLSPLAAPGQAKRRMFLRELMMKEGFAPFPGEWWHFSFGDREWAIFYGQPKTFYGPVFKIVEDKPIRNKEIRKTLPV